MGASKKNKALLADKNMTQVVLANKAGKSTQTLRNMLARDSTSIGEESPTSKR